MSVVRLNSDIIKKLVETEFKNGVEGLQDRWITAFGDAAKDSAKVPDRATVYRWMQGTMPRSRLDFLRLCALLDVDPLAMLVAKDADTEKAIEHLLSSFQLDHWHKPALSFLTGFFGRQTDWPPAQYARDHYGRAWHVQDFTHNPRKASNYYALVEIAGSEDVYSRRPQVHHFAYRKPGYFRDRWLEYGIVERYGKKVRLFHINGHLEDYETGVLDEPSRVETWFGPGEAVFRVASLHPFSLTVLKSNEQRRSCVRFPG